MRSANCEERSQALNRDEQGHEGHDEEDDHRDDRHGPPLTQIDGKIGERLHLDVRRIPRAFNWSHRRPCPCALLRTVPALVDSSTLAMTPEELDALLSDAATPTGDPEQSEMADDLEDQGCPLLATLCRHGLAQVFSTYDFIDAYTDRAAEPALARSELTAGGCRPTEDSADHPARERVRGSTRSITRSRSTA